MTRLRQAAASLLLVLLATAALVVPPSGASPAAPTGRATPQLSTETTSAAVGDQVTFAVRGFAADRVQVELCGRRGVTSSLDCDVSGGALALVSGPERTGSAILRLAAPPGDCPCRVRAVGIGTRESAVLPFAVTGVPQRGALHRPAGPPAPTSVAVSVAVAKPAGAVERLRGWFGLSDRREVEVAVRNTGSAALSDSRVQLRIGRDATDAAHVASAALPSLAPGEETTLRVPVDLSDGVAAGRYVVVGSVSGADTGGSFGTQASTMPVLLLTAGLALALTVALSVVRRAARRRDRARGRTPRALGLPWLVALASTVLVVGAGMVVRSVWVDQADERTVRVAQEDLLEQFPAVRPPRARAAQPRPGTGALVAVLRLPRDQTWAVVEGVDPTQLGRAPGHYPGTALPGGIGNSVIVGHSGIPDAPFDDVSRLRKGDPIAVDTAQRSWRYVVTGVREVAATATDVLLPVRSRPGAAPSEAQLTLITCSYEQGVVSGRWVVEAVLAGPDGAAA